MFNPDTHTHIGGLIREARQNKRLSVRFVAKELGIDPANYYRIEHGKINPTFSTVLLILKYLGVTSININIL